MTKAITLRTYRILKILDKESCIKSSLARKLECIFEGVREQINNLEDKGFINVEKVENKRNMLCSITIKGKAFLSELRNFYEPNKERE